MNNFITKLKYYLGLPVVVKLTIGWVVTKRTFGIREYLDTRRDFWWCIEDGIKYYATFKTKEEAEQALQDGYRQPLSVRWHDM